MSEWISVKERLPKEREIVLCAAWRGVYVGYLSGRDLDGKAHFIVGNNSQYDAWTWEPDITHWMPLPEPPKEDV